MIDPFSTNRDTVKRHTISQLLDTSLAGQEVTVCGWVRTFRNDQFLSINDGSSLANLQLVVDREGSSEALLKRLTTGAAIRAVGTLVESQGKGQATEVEVRELEGVHTLTVVVVGLAIVQCLFRVLKAD